MATNGSANNGNLSDHEEEEVMIQPSHAEQVEISMTTMMKMPSFEQSTDPDTDLSSLPLLAFRDVLFRAIKLNRQLLIPEMCLIAQQRDFDLASDDFKEDQFRNSPLDVALIFTNREIAKTLLDFFPELITTVNDSDENCEQTPFHLAAANNFCDTLRIMLRKIPLKSKPNFTVSNALDGIVTGTFHKDDTSNSLVLSSAMHAGHENCLKLLLQAEANCLFGIKDCRGNTPLHHLVRISAAHPDQQVKVNRMFDQFWEYCHISGAKVCQKNTIDMTKSELNSFRKDIMRLMLKTKNRSGQTPLMLSVNLRAPLAHYIIQYDHLHRDVQVEYGSQRYVTYDVTDVTSLSPGNQGRLNYNTESLLHILAHRAKIISKDENNAEDLITVHPIHGLVEMKWDFYKWMYYIWAVWHFGFMLIFTWYSTYFMDTERFNLTVRATLAANQTRNWALENHLLPHLFLLLPLTYLFFEMIDLFFIGYWSIASLSTGGKMGALKGLASQWTISGNGPQRVGFAGFSVSYVVWYCYHLQGLEDQDYSLAATLIFGWITMMNFLRAIKSTNRFSVMIQKMFLVDFFKFALVYIALWLAFSSGLYALYSPQRRQELTLWNALYRTLNSILGSGPTSSEDDARVREAGAWILALYTIIAVILLLNMLIAMMNSSYEQVKDAKTNIWQYQKLSILLMLERRLAWFNLGKQLCLKSQKTLFNPEEGRGKYRMELEDVRVKKIQKHRKKLFYMEIVERSFTEKEDEAEWETEPFLQV